MEQANTYSYSYQPRQRSPSTASTRTNGAYQNSSAFSASANPDEDWTKISDLAERRRIQNRIAQRNYRKKLKRRLEDLERNATSTSASPEQSHRELAQIPNNDVSLPEQHSTQRRASTPKIGLPPRERNYATDLFSTTESWMNQANSPKPALSFSAPSAYSFSGSYASTTDCFPDDFSTTTYSQMPMMYPNPTYSQQYMQSVSPPMTSMVPSETYKAEQQYSGGDLLTPFNMNYASLAGFSVPTTQGLSDLASRTPPLTASASFFDLEQYSPPQFSLPLTPESRSASPNIALFDQTEI